MMNPMQRCSIFPDHRCIQSAIVWHSIGLSACRVARIRGDGCSSITHLRQTL